jgi:Xaa-Pro aminopeptidase
MGSSPTIHDLSPILDGLRLIKSPRELDLMRRAGRLTALATAQAMRATAPGRMEYQLAAVADYLFAVGGARGPGYRAIVAGGANIANAHYFRNDCPLFDGDLVLMDYAPDCGNYTSDIGRMWPVSGRYSPAQREVYGFVVAYHQALLAVIRPAAAVADLVQEAAARIEPTWAAWPFSRPAWREAARRMIDSPVAFTHPVGMAVHDVGEYRQQPLRPGLVFALDPQMWVPDEQLYIRVEDTVAITADGVESLTAACPLELDEVERWMAGPGLLESLSALEWKT